VRPLLAILVLTALAVVATRPLRADWKDDVGYTRLQQTYATGVPVSVTNGVTQVEAGDASGNNYLPDSAQSIFSGKTIANKSSGTGVSDHANGVGSYFYGNTSSLIPATTLIDAYAAVHWQGAGYLNFGTQNYPAVESRRVQNHSWIGSYDRGAYSIENIGASVAHLNTRLDYAINRDGFTCVVGMGNGASTTLPDVLGQGYHTISVGLVNGQHSAGLTAFDIAGRMKPDLVSFEGVTSYTTPQVASAAALLSEKLRNTTHAVTLATADYPRLTKALLLAGAAKEPLSSWSRADTAKPYDAVYGAGALNVLLSYRILSSGYVAPSANSTVPPTAWSVGGVSSPPAANATRTYFFDIPSASASAPFSAALVWHRAIDNSLAATMANLDLRLYNVTANTYDLDTLLDSSVSTVDNVEHIYQPALAPGRYALQVTKAAGASTNYALAWRTSPTVTVAATVPVARELDTSPAVFTVTRTGPATSPLYVPLAWGGTAVSGTHYTTPAPSVLIPAGATSATLSITPVADSIAQGDRTVTLSITTDFSLSAGSPESASATIRDKPFDAWRFTRFTTEDLADPAISGDSADPDADGLSNLLEYALGSEPKTSDATAHSPASGLDNDRLTLTYTRPASTSDLTYAIEWSSDLQSWNSGSAFTETLSSTDNGNGTTTVISRALTSLATTPRQFLRLRVTR
jgi:hypothetical protein